jgi:hypothetical protein
VSHKAIAGDVNAWFVRDLFFQCNAACMTHNAVQLRRDFHSHGVRNEIDFTSDAKSFHESDICIHFL